LQKWCIFNVKKLANFIEVNINLAFLIMTYPGSSYYIYIVMMSESNMLSYNETS